MEQLRLVGVHDDGEHLIVETPDSTRYRLKIDQQLRQTIQHARRKPPSHGRGGGSFGPRDIQARFRAGASVEDVVAESGWEAERVKRYEWPILAERSHVVAEACRVTVSGTNPSHEGYRSVFEGEPRTLRETVDERAAELGVDRSSFDWDAWLREDQLWTVQLSFSAEDASQDAPDIPGPAQWSYNPANRTVRPENDWARALGQEHQESGPLGAAAHALPPAPTAKLRQLQHEASQADDLLDVLQSRRGRRIGSDEAGDDRLAEILGRGMGQVDQRPRPIDAPEDSTVFDQPIQPAASQVAEAQALAQDDGIEIVDDSTPLEHDDATPSRNAAAPAVPFGKGSYDDSPAASRNENVPSAVTDHQPADCTSEDPAPEDSGSENSGEDEHAATETEARDTTSDSAFAVDASGTATDVADEDEPAAQDTDEPARSGDADTTDESGSSDRPAPGPRGRTPKAKRSSVPSWDDIVFGANRS